MVWLVDQHVCDRNQVSYICNDCLDSFECWLQKIKPFAENTFLVLGTDSRKK